MFASGGRGSIEERLQWSEGLLLYFGLNNQMCSCDVLRSSDGGKVISLEETRSHVTNAEPQGSLYSHEKENLFLWALICAFLTVVETVPFSKPTCVFIREPQLNVLDSKPPCLLLLCNTKSDHLQTKSITIYSNVIFQYGHLIQIRRILFLTVKMCIYSIVSSIIQPSPCVERRATPTKATSIRVYIYIVK